MRTRFAVIWTVLTAVIAGIAAYLAYGVGIATRVATAPEGTVTYYHGGFFPFFGFLPFLFILLLLFFVFRPRRRWWGGGWRGPHGMHGGHPGGYPKGVPPVIDERLRSWHRQEHGEPEPPAPPERPAADRTEA